MRLYTRTGATALTDPETGICYEADSQGGFNLPDDLSDKLHRFALRGQPMWENDIERQRRLMAEEMERRRDPATLMDAVQQLVNAAQSVSVPAEVPAPDQAVQAPAKRASKRAASAPAAE